MIIFCARSAVRGGVILSEVDAGPLNGVCYVRWDVVPCLALATDPNLPVLHDAALSTMKRILHLDSLARQEKPLRGLGRWQSGYQERVAAIIDNFCEAYPKTGPRLLAMPNLPDADACFDEQPRSPARGHPRTLRASKNEVNLPQAQEHPTTRTP